MQITTVFLWIRTVFTWMTEGSMHALTITIYKSIYSLAGHSPAWLVGNKFPTLSGSYNRPIYRACTGGQDKPATAILISYSIEFSII